MIKAHDLNFDNGKYILYISDLLHVFDNDAYVDQFLFVYFQLLCYVPRRSQSER